MKESTFYDLMDNIRAVSVPDEYAHYYPSVEEISDALQEASVEQLAPVLLYFSSDPLANDEEVSDSPNYKKTVQHCQQLVAEIPLESED